MPAKIGVEGVAEVVMPEDGQLRNRVADPVVGFTQSLRADCIVSRALI